MKIPEKKQEIQQLDASIIIKRRKNKINEMGLLEDDKIGFTCRNCVHFATARTPFNSDFRKMKAWKKGEVAELCPCPYLNGVQNESGEKELIKGNMNSSECQHFCLNRNRIPQKYFDFIIKADNGEIQTCESMDLFMNFIKEQEEKIAKAQEHIEKAKAALEEARKAKEELVVERDMSFLERYTNHNINGERIPDGFAMLAGAELGFNYERKQKNLQKIIEAGYDPTKHKYFPYNITSMDLQRIMTNHRDTTYGGLFKDGVDCNGRTLDSYIGETIELEGEPIEVISRGAKRLVMFIETNESLEKRKQSTIAKLLFSDKKVQWKCPVIEKPKMEFEEETDEEDNSEEEEE